MIWNLLVKISLCLDLYFWSYEGLKCMSRLMSQLMALWADWHAKISLGMLDFWLGTTCESTHESTHKAWVDSWVDLCWFEPKNPEIRPSGLCNRSRLMSRLLMHESTHESTPAMENVSNGYFFVHFNCHLFFLKLL